MIERKETVEFTEEAVKEYLDSAIRHWREVRDEERSQKAAHYVDAFQSVRISLFGETLSGGGLVIMDNFRIVGVGERMVVVLSYFSDGSGKPEIEFIEAGPDQVERVARYLAAVVEDGKEIEMFRIDALGKAPLCLSEIGDDA